MRCADTEASGAAFVGWGHKQVGHARQTTPAAAQLPVVVLLLSQQVPAATACAVSAVLGKWNGDGFCGVLSVLTCMLCLPCCLPVPPLLQLKELLQPYGQLKSLTVAMDAATGKNKVCAMHGACVCLHACKRHAASSLLARARSRLVCRLV